MQNYTNPSPVQQFFHNKWVISFIVFDVILLIALIATFIWQSTKVSTISFNVTPLDSTIAINGNNNYKNGQYSLTPGTYQISISHEGLETKTFTIDLSPEHLVTISTILSDQAKTFDYYELRSNFASYQKLEEIASADNNTTTDHDTSAESFIQRFQKEYAAFTNQLPFDYYESEGYGQTLEIQKNITFSAKYDCENTLCIKASVVGTEDENFIESLLQEKGFNMEDYEINYVFY